MNLPLLPTQILENCYTDSRLDEILEYFLKFGEDHPYVHQWEGPLCGKTINVRKKLVWEDHPHFQELVTSGIPKNIVDIMLVQTGFYLRSFLPLPIHSDLSFLNCADDESSFLVFIIPFESADARTITFDQITTSAHFVDYKKTHDPLPEGQCISEQDYKLYFGHCWPQERQYLSIDKIFRWKKGSVLMFDTQRWHSSDNYAANGLSEKNCLVVQTKIKTHLLLQYKKDLQI